MLKNLFVYGVDVDDVLYSCNQYACDIVNGKTKYSEESLRHVFDRFRKKTGIPVCKDYFSKNPLRLSDIKTWEPRLDVSDIVMEFFLEEEFFRTQPVIRGAEHFLRSLMHWGSVRIISSVEPQFMGIRVQKLLTDFPFLKRENIVLAYDKSMLQMDFLFDDCPRNLLIPSVKYPIRMEKPWNKHMTGGLFAKGLTDALQLVMRISDTKTYTNTEDIRVAVLVGPSGSGKTTIMEASSYRQIPSVTDRPRRNGEVEGNYIFISPSEFSSGQKMGRFLESSEYAGHHYGTRKEDAVRAASLGACVKAMDIDGAIRMKEYMGNRCSIIYVKRDRKRLVEAILERNISNEEKTRRIVGLDVEEQNESYADFVIDNNGRLEDSVAQLKNILH